MIFEVIISMLKSAFFNGESIEEIFHYLKIEKAKETLKTVQVQVLL